MTFRYFFALCLLWSTAAGLLGCGAGGGGQETPKPETTTPLVQAGVYYDNSSGHDFWGVITPSNRWFALNYKTPYPDIYAGPLTGAGTTQAAVAALTYQNSTNTFLVGSASITSPGPGQLAGALSLITTPSIQPVTFNATSPSGFNYNLAADLSALSGNWSGKLSSNMGEFGVFNISIAGDTGSLSHTGNFGACQWRGANAQVAPLSGVNLFALKLQLEHATLCNPHLDGQTLNGVAFVTPGTGQTRRLIWVATTSEGYALSFQAER